MCDNLLVPHLWHRFRFRIGGGQSQFNFLTRTLSDPFWPQIIMGLCQSISSLNFAKNPAHQHDPFARHLLLKSHQLFSHPWCRCWACKRGDPDPTFFVPLTKCNCLLKTLRLFSKTNRLYYKHSTRAALFAFQFALPIRQSAASRASWNSRTRIHTRVAPTVN